MGGTRGMGGGSHLSDSHHGGFYGGLATSGHGAIHSEMGSRGGHDHGYSRPPRRGGRRGPRMPPGVVADPRSPRSVW